jgi:hypothetical protein
MRIMIDNPHGTAPLPEQAPSAAAIANTGAEEDNSNAIVNTAPALSQKELRELAWALSPGGPLRRHVPRRPAWRRRIGQDVFDSLYMRCLHPSEIKMLEDAYREAVATRDHAEELAETVRSMKTTYRR